MSDAKMSIEVAESTLRNNYHMPKYADAIADLRAELARVREERDEARRERNEANHRIKELRSVISDAYSASIHGRPLVAEDILKAAMTDPPRPSITEPADRVASVIPEQSTSRPLRDIIAEKIQP